MNSLSYTNLVKIIAYIHKKVKPLGEICFCIANKNSSERYYGVVFLKTTLSTPKTALCKTAYLRAYKAVGVVCEVFYNFLYGEEKKAMSSVSL